MNILVLNCGSSSVKYKLYDMRGCKSLAAGILERIGERDSRLTHHWRAGEQRREEQVSERPVADHREALLRIGEVLRATGVLVHPDALDGIGHRVVHGGERFREPVVITDKVMSAIREMAPLAPLHNPANLAGIEVAHDFAPRVPQVAVFDTAFHQSLPPPAYLYAIPYRCYEELQVRRYGFHGISHQYVTREAARLLGCATDAVNLVTLHLGNGTSATAVQQGHSVDTSMGMTPLEGLVMGTRCGDLDPSIPFYLEKWAGLEPERVEALLNRDSGLKGICGVGDMREIQQLAETGNERARLAIDLFCYRIRKYIGAYLAVLGKVDAVVFTGGIGENSPLIRARCCQGLEPLGIAIDGARNRGPLEPAAEIQHSRSATRILVIRSDEEREIARQTMARIADTITD
ncbi:MAG: acetate kinase [Gammaproteobacteria bacterium]|jgi:acetate kinase